MTAFIGVFLFFVVFLLIVLLANSIRVVREYDRLVVFRLGRVVGERGPGLVLLIPIVDRAVKVGLRTVTMDVPPQDIITKDNVSVKVNAVIYFRVVGAVQAVIEVENFLYATSQIAQTTLRSILGAGRAGRAALRAREAEPGAAAGDRSPDRAVGRQGHDGRGQERRPAAGDATRDRAAGGGRARAPRQGDQRRGRVPGFDAAGRSRGGAGTRTGGAPACATFRRSPRSRPRTTRPRSSRCPWTSSRRS